MKLDVVANIRLPSERAGTLQTVRMCDAFARCGAEVRLVYPFRFQSPAMRRVRNWRWFYDVGPTFATQCLPTLDLQIPSDPFVTPRVRALLFHVQNVSFAAAVWCDALISGADAVYTREPLLAGLLPRPGGRKVFVEVHQVPEKGRAHFLRSLMSADAVVVISHGLKEDLAELGVPVERIVVAPDGVDLERFEEVDASPAPELPADEVAVGYTGQLLKWKGVHTLARASRDLPPNVKLYFLGGWDWQVEDFRRFCRAESLDRVEVMGMVPPMTVPSWLKRFDVLALPNSASERISARHTSPLKLFEYMAAGRPIVASDLPSLREVLRDGENAVLVPPDDPKALAAGIRRVIDDRSLAAKLVAQAQEDVTQYSWTSRAKRLLEFMNSLVPS